MHFSPVKPTMSDRIEAASDEIYVVNATIGGTGAQTVNVFQYTSTDNPIDFDMIIYFKYRIMNGGSLSIVGA